MSLDINIGRLSQPSSGFDINISDPSSRFLDVTITGDTQPSVGFDVVIGVAPLKIVIGRDTQPSVGFDIVMGSSPSAILDLTLPASPLGSILLFVLVRNNDEQAYPSDLTWTKIVNGLGASDARIDVYARVSDGTVGARAGDVVSFLSMGRQELQGTLAIVRDARMSTLLTQALDEVFATAQRIGAPPARSLNSQDSIMVIWSADGATSMSAPAGFTRLDTYSSSVVRSRTILAVARTAGLIAPIIDVGLAAAVTPSTGRAFTLSLAYDPKSVASLPVSELESADLIGNGATEDPTCDLDDASIVADVTTTVLAVQPILVASPDAPYSALCADVDESVPGWSSDLDEASELDGEDVGDFDRASLEAEVDETEMS